MKAKSTSTITGSKSKLSTAPAIAMISVGKGNTYGHPAPQTVRALTRLGAKVVRTDTDGAIAITAKNHRLSIKLARSGIHIFRLG